MNPFEYMLRGDEKRNAVYCYNFPEVRCVFKEFNQFLLDNNILDFIFQNTIPVQKLQEPIDRTFVNIPTIPATPKGFIDLDGLGRIAGEYIREVYKPILKGIEGFRYVYPTHGANEGIIHVLMNTGCDDTLTTVKGDYEGFDIRAAQLGIELWNYTLEDLLTLHNPKYLDNELILSNPSAIDGNIIPNELINALCGKGYRPIIDLSYVGSTPKYEYDISNPNIETVLLSFSKPYGLFRSRIGFVFSRNEIPNLIGNKWFNDPLRLLFVMKLLDDFEPGYLYRKYSKIQKLIIDDLKQYSGFGITPSDVVILANMKSDSKLTISDDLKNILPKFRRGYLYRFCLTPLFELFEGGDK